LEVSLFIVIFLLLANLSLWAEVLFLGFLRLGALRAVALPRWRVDQLEAITPGRVGRSGLRPGKKAPKFTLPRIVGDTAGGEVGLEHYAGRELLPVFMQPGCGPCHGITPELNRLHDAGEVQVLVVHNGSTEAVWGPAHHSLMIPHRHRTDGSAGERPSRDSEPTVALRTSVRRHRRAQGGSPMRRSIRPKRAAPK
jgi:hypothetical protein